MITVEKGIPEADLKAINDSFKEMGPVETILKNEDGAMVGAKKSLVNDRTFVFKDFSRKVLKHQKSIFYPDKGLVVIGVKGQKYADIPEEKRSLVRWFDSDFE